MKPTTANSQSQQEKARPLTRLINFLSNSNFMSIFQRKPEKPHLKKEAEYQAQPTSKGQVESSNSNSKTLNILILGLASSLVVLGVVDPSARTTTIELAKSTVLMYTGWVMRENSSSSKPTDKEDK